MNQRLTKRLDGKLISPNRGKGAWGSPVMSSKGHWSRVDTFSFLADDFWHFCLSNRIVLKVNKYRSKKFEETPIIKEEQTRLKGNGFEIVIKWEP